MITASISTIIIGNTAASATLALADSSYGAAGIEVISLRQRGPDRCQRLLYLLAHFGRLEAFVDVAAYGDGRHAVAAFEDRRLGTVFDAADLLQRHAPPIRGRQRQVGQPRGIKSLRARSACLDFYCAYILAHLRHRHTAQQKLKLLRCRLRVELDRPQPHLVEHEMRSRYAIAPIGVDLAHVRVGAHHCCDLSGDLTETFDVRAGNSERYGIGHRRAEQ